MLANALHPTAYPAAMDEATGEPACASGSGPSKSKTSAEDMVRVTRDAKIIDLRRDGHTYVQIGTTVGVPKSSVADAVKRRMDANGPSTEQVEELRQLSPRLTT